MKELGKQKWGYQPRNTFRDKGTKNVQPDQHTKYIRNPQNHHIAIPHKETK